MAFTSYGYVTNLLARNLTILAVVVQAKLRFNSLLKPVG